MVVAFPCKNGAPVTGITLSTRVGRLSETHSDTCIQLTQLPRWEERRRTARWKSQRNCMLNIVQSGCKMINRWLSKTVWLEKVSESAQVKAAFSSCNAEGKWFVGSIMNHHGNKKGDWTACAKVVAGTHQSVLWCFPSRCPALLDQVSSEMPGPPACEKWWWKTLCPGVDTHTHTAMASIVMASNLRAMANNLRAMASDRIAMASNLRAMAPPTE